MKAIKKTALLSLLLPLGFISPPSYAEELTSLFGITLHDNAENYVTKEYIENYKHKDYETSGGYYGLDVTDSVPNKNLFFADYYDITLDDSNIIHSIVSGSEMGGLDWCLEARDGLILTLERKYQMEFKDWEDTLLQFKTYLRYDYTNNNDLIGVQCKVHHDNSFITLQIRFAGKAYRKAVNDFYETVL